jgi:hypothetical protein
MNLMPFLIIWMVLAVAVLALFIWRQTVARNEDDNLHVMDGAAVQETAQQAVVAQKLEFIDKWGKIITVVALVYGVVIGGLYVYQSWVQNATQGM